MYIPENIGQWVSGAAPGPNTSGPTGPKRVNDLTKSDKDVRIYRRPYRVLISCRARDSSQDAYDLYQLTIITGCYRFFTFTL
jgi:hypothetical protein